MTPSILSREGEKRAISALSLLAHETRETNGRIKRCAIPRYARQHWLADICGVVSYLRETRETRPTEVLSRCLSLPLGERHARQDRVHGVLLGHSN